MVQNNCVACVKSSWMSGRGKTRTKTRMSQTYKRELIILCVGRSTNHQDLIPLIPWIYTTASGGGNLGGY